MSVQVQRSKSPTSPVQSPQPCTSRVAWPPHAAPPSPLVVRRASTPLVSAATPIMVGRTPPASAGTRLPSPRSPPRSYSPVVNRARVWMSAEATRSIAPRLASAALRPSLSDYHQVPTPTRIAAIPPRMSPLVRQSYPSDYLLSTAKASPEISEAKLGRSSLDNALGNAQSWRQCSDSLPHVFPEGMNFDEKSAPKLSVDFATCGPFQWAGVEPKRSVDINGASTPKAFVEAFPSSAAFEMESPYVLKEGIPQSPISASQTEEDTTFFRDAFPCLAPSEWAIAKPTCTQDNKMETPKVPKEDFSQSPASQTSEATTFFCERSNSCDSLGCLSSTTEGSSTEKSSAESSPIPTFKTPADATESIPAAPQVFEDNTLDGKRSSSCDSLEQLSTASAATVSSRSSSTDFAISTVPLIDTAQTMKLKDAAESVTAAAQALSTVTDALLAAAGSKEPLIDTSSSMTADVVAAAHESVAAVLAGRFVDLGQHPEEAADNARELISHKNTLLNLIKVKQQCMQIDSLLRA